MSPRNMSIFQKQASHHVSERGERDHDGGEEE